MSAHGRPRTPGLVYGVLALVLVVLLGITALTSRQPPPPTIAEFAPQAVEQIVDAPNDQSSTVGRGAGTGIGPGDGGGGEFEVALPQAAIDVPRVRRCVGDPPRQIEDPQSPPCVPYWSGDNGGATWKGVTRDEIRLGSHGDMRDILVDFFNKRFEFYGRKMHVVVKGDGDTYGSGDEPEQRRADAIAADEQHNLFAGLVYDTDGDGEFFEEMARRGRMAFESHAPHYPESWLQGLAPFAWMYVMSADRILANAGEWGCKRLVGGKAVHSGDALMQSRPRKFGLLIEVGTAQAAKADPFLKEFEACGAEVKSERGPGLDPTGASNAMLQMKNENISTIFCFCNVITTGLYGKSATGQAYFPEWVLSTFTYNDDNFNLQNLHGERSQLEHTMGLTFRPRQVTIDDTPGYWANKEMDPGFTDSKDGFGHELRNYDYQQLLVLASGIQMAGPNLTPYTFEAALHRTKFPNPPVPTNPGAVGFQDGDHSMTDDGAEWWWSNSARGPYASDSGAICYVDHGARHAKGHWPSGGDPFFNALECDSGATS